MKKILLVEDDLTLSQGIEFTLLKEGFHVHVANTLKAADHIYINQEVDLILLDVMLPDGSGYDLCKRIREKSQVPIVFLTACDDEVNVVLGLDIGGDDYITKPFRVKELVSRIKAILRRGSPVEVNSTLQSGEITLDPLQGKVWKSGREILLSPMEWKLMKVFIQNTGQLLTRNTILEKLWDVSGEFVDDNTLSVYIRRLREKIEDKPSEPKFIETVRGMGYRWKQS
ncbi:response regulator transcription factor [Alkalicella caledoniensis]|uniref:Stage 0 sporulation protein A homolog n=1 Tax=Alkalicella caledoniensis TaxID=2731377 RepID=A0A7G9W9C7_ALKCA|nr:response regulator transcription factor [Alkalicella caledoniensis]QNO15289.1 response regulator transcription factor [Alkalicella caledoniensis]